MLTKLCMMYDMIQVNIHCIWQLNRKVMVLSNYIQDLVLHPYLGAYKGCTEQKSKNAWQNVTEILRCKA